MAVPRDDQNVKSILVSGGAGYLGSTMVPLFLKEGYKVTIYDIFRWGSASLLGILHDPNLTVIKGMFIVEFFDIKMRSKLRFHGQEFLTKICRQF